MTKKKSPGRDLLRKISENCSFSFDFDLRFNYFSAFFWKWKLAHIKGGEIESV